MPDLQTKIAFSMIRKLHPELAEQLIARIGSEEAFFTMAAESLRTIAQLPAEMIAAPTRATLIDKAEKEMRFVLSKQIDTLYFRDAEYPSRLLECQDGPMLLYKIGKTDLESRHIVGIVGTRHATPYGIETANRIVRELSERLDDLVIVSGLAYGIDVAAHRAALSCNVPTVGVVAHPLNTIYPADHRAIAVQMVRDGGAIVSEYPTCSVTHQGNFLERNRIVAGLSDVLIVVESALKGGAMVTARLASEYNREVFAVPGRVIDRYSQGCNALIAGNCARLYTEADDIINCMGWEVKEAPGEQKELPLSLTPEEQKVVDYLIEHPGARQPEITIATGIAAGRLKDILFNMEMEDKILCMAGGKYSAITT